MNPPTEQSWRSDDGTLVLRYAPQILEEIRADVMLAMYGPGRGFVETGGLLLGRRDSSGAGFVLEGWRPIRCDHSRGASFLLSGRDVAFLSSQIDGLSAVRGPRVIGWYAAHARGEASMRAEEQTLHGRVLPADAPLFMIFAPGKFGDSLLHFYLVEKGDPPTATPVAGRLLLSPLPALARESERLRPVAPKASARPRRVSQRWIWPAVAAAAALVFAAAGWSVWRMPASSGSAHGQQMVLEPTGPPVPLTTIHIDQLGDRLEISWDPLIGDTPGTVAALTVIDQGRAFVRRLSMEELKLGRIHYTRSTSEIRVALHVERPGAAPLRARSHYQAPVPATADQ